MGEMGSKVGGAAPGFEPGTSCMQVRSRSHYTKGAVPKEINYFLLLVCGKDMWHFSYEFCFFGHVFLHLRLLHKF